MKNPFTPIRSLILLLLVSLSITTYSQELSSLVAGEATPKLVSSQFSFTEGPAVDKQGNVYFTDQPNNKIWKYSTDGKLSVFLDKAGRSNGMFFDKQGNLITCADEKNELWSISPKGQVTVLLKDYQGHTFNGPNDLWIDPKGGIYFTDPYFQREYWERKSPDPGMNGEKLYYLAKGKKEPVLVDMEIKKPNGLIGTPDGKYLYVADMGNKAIFRYDIGANGSLTNRQPFAEEVIDGMTIDTQGNIYMAGKGVSIYNPKGEKIGQIEVPAKWTANVCFGGKNRDMLFITASESVFVLPMKVKGAY
ncbi:SMP-30/gluconolactonase/LRE family protein [Rhodocytophaga aerolata]|uniref:SMP-30/gluconolactonase/LRE family protein n=1 Tax=Rhodocytophaga aerolata TaxID=455078 RepID=A0ABT8RA58_9BACT|nr:SMP-30/gluconolactonase/LRE family protein [Rhodocytophaga aerolata]MDO1448224.1 SMP-30/gluconolactonase/LRE family protein [Rhodocytophaga aerolata]